MTSFSDDFNRSDSTDLGGSWVEVSGDWSISSNRLSPGAAGGVVILRAATAMAGNDHFVQVTIAATTAASHGVWARGNSTISQGYLLRNDGTSWNLFHVIGGSFTSIGSYAAAAAAGDVVKLQCVGSTIKGFINGTERISVTDTSVPTGTSVGIRSESASAIRFDDFSAGDITAGATLGIASSVETAQALTGSKAATLALAAAVDSAHPVTGAKTAALTPAGETGSTQPLAGSKTTTLAPAAETATAQVLTGAKAAMLTTAVEVGAAQMLTAVVTAPLATSSTVEAAQALVGAKTAAAGIAASTETTQPVTGIKTATLAPAVEVDAAQPLTAAETETGTLPTVSTVETALPLAGTKTAVLPPAVEVDAAHPLTRPSTFVPSRERTYKIPAERRRLLVAAEHRTLKVRR